MSGEESNLKVRSVAIAILYRGDQFLCQLRDNIPTIIHPGCWALFGGHLEANESPESGLKRELQEEINYTPSNVELFGCYNLPEVIRYVFHAALNVEISELELHEGWDMAMLTIDEIRSGQKYSAKANQIRPLCDSHHQILLDFITQS